MATRKKPVIKRKLERAKPMVHPEQIAPLVFLFRADKVLLDTDLAKLYGLKTSALNQAVKRNQERFPKNFLLKLSEDEPAELRSLRSQTLILKEAKPKRRIGFHSDLSKLAKSPYCG